METLTVVLAVRNEEKGIGACLEGVRWADEIVVVDMNSVDATAEIAGRHTPHVHVHDGGPHGFVHVNRNFGIDRATGSWILCLDADERLSAELEDEIRHVLREPGEAVAYAIPFRHYFFGRYLRHGGWNFPIVRLFRRGKARYDEDRAHSELKVDGTVGRLRFPIVHFAHPRIRVFIDKMNRYTTQDVANLDVLGRGGLRNRRVGRVGVWAMFRAPVGLFWTRYITRRGFLDGPQGFIAAVLVAFYQFVEYAKLWERRNVPSDGPSSGGR